MSTEDCPVCSDECKEQLSCGHFVHQSCVARSGKSKCPVCRADVVLSEEHTALLAQSAQSLNNHLQAQADQESVQLARQLQTAEISAERGGQRTRTIRTPYGRNVSIRLEAQPAAYLVDELLASVAKLQEDIAERRRAISADPVTIDLVTLIWSFRELAVETGLTVGNLTDIVGTLGE